MNAFSDNACSGAVGGVCNFGIGEGRGNIEVCGIAGIVADARIELASSLFVVPSMGSADMHQGIGSCRNSHDQLLRSLVDCQHKLE